ncbi:MAG: LAGLIDADG family homing endonuclease [Nanoarchaeota archaeon]
MKINRNYLILSEAIRTEGYIMKEKNMQGAAISNKDINILNSIESAYKSICKNRNTSKILVIILYLKNKEKIQKLVNFKTKKELKFSIDKYDRLISTHSIKNFDINLSYVVISNNRSYELKIKVSKEGIITTQCPIQSTSYATLQIYNAPFMRKLKKEFDIPLGKKSYRIDFPFEIEKLSKNQIKTILDIVISCEGCVFYNKKNKDRIIKIKLASKKYLEKLEHMFKRLGVTCQKIRPTTDGLFVLDIRRKDNLKKLNKEVNLTSKKKQRILDEIANSYNIKRFTHYSAQKEYLLLIKKYGPISIKEASKKILKGEHTVHFYFKKLIKEGYSTKFNGKPPKIGKTPKVYKITKDGLNFLNNHR